MVTDEEREAIVNEVLEKLKAVKRLQGSSSQILNPTLRKWFQTNDGSYINSPMQKMTGDVAMSNAIWDGVRKATCGIFGVKYVRQFDYRDAEKVNAVADSLCQAIYDMAIAERGEF